ncbi:GAF domain-containing protein [Luteipulveratus mongoliensis]|uniref:GAF domain-containing protein n=1 Tax=Luteipulveratus mongoliensis TaxID=571913 RepID=A0A0K1JHW9_9MICO|nr:GAF domain-containing protein [Luteipulveratus mongoliensis]AKU16296.1 hypothetical protein VV02_11190 [Luteipulveratus mongoliensis]
MDDQDRAQRRTRERVLSGGHGAAARPEIAASWRRLRASGLDPGSNPEVAPLDRSDIEERRTTSGLLPLLPHLTSALKSVVDAGQLVVITDREGRVLWRQGGSQVRRFADRLGFVSGSAWTEGNVGTNAIGTCLVLNAPVQIRGGEHYVESHTQWGCAAAPISDPWTGRTLGVIDVSGPSRAMHPAELALVEMSARLGAMEVREQHRTRLGRLRADSAGLLERLTGQALVVDQAGHVAAATGLAAPDRVMLPSTVGEGGLWLPGLGPAVAEPLPGGWLLRLGSDQEAVPTGALLDLSGAPHLAVSGPTGSWRYDLSPRHAEILISLIDAGPTGRTAAALADDLFADPTRAVTVRAEMSRLRQTLGPLLLSQPYRLSPQVDARLRLPTNLRSLMPSSSAPVVVRLRASC